ncbi:MAG: hypothetical protein AAF998_27340 [Bacteroidota bacterium]
MIAKQNPLYVPVELRAFVVNDQVRAKQQFARWEYNFDALRDYNSPLPPPYAPNTGEAWGSRPNVNGVYLHWTLPRALRSGQQNPLTGEAEYPLLPNRWLVLRYSGPTDDRKVKGWIVESDYLLPSDKGTAFLDFRGTSPEQISIGRKRDLGGWTENAVGDQFLTVVGPGDITWTSYQPYVEDVFSLVDPLTDVGNTDTLSYLVAGWYANRDADILDQVPVDQLTAFLAEQNWRVSESRMPFTQSIYHGMVLEIDWDKNGPVPESDRPKSRTVFHAVGNTAIDALTALIDRQATIAQQDNIDAKLLEAFQYNLLPKLDEPNGPVLLEQAIHKAWFGVFPGGYDWTIVAESDANAIGAAANRSANLSPRWLNELNQTQRDLDAAVLELKHLKQKLYELWFTKGKLDSSDASTQALLQTFNRNLEVAKLNEQLGAKAEDSLLSQVKALAKTVLDLQKLVPQGDTPVKLQNAIRDYAFDKGLPDGFELKRVARKDFFEANNPVVLVSGARVDDILVEDAALPCRGIDELVRGLDVGGNIQVVGEGPKNPLLEPGLEALPEAIPPLVKEFYFLDPGNAGLINLELPNSDTTVEFLEEKIQERDFVIGTLPRYGTRSWRQPWSPLFLMWEIDYYPIPFGDGNSNEWTFDGDRYEWNGLGQNSDFKPIPFRGRTLLTPQNQFNFKRQLDAYITKNPDFAPETLGALADFIEAVDKWDFLSQNLDGFMPGLAGLDNDVHLTPPDGSQIANFIEDIDYLAPELGDTPRSRIGFPPSNFQALRAGQFEFTRLTVVDRFGQTVEVVGEQRTLGAQAAIAPDLVPGRPVILDGSKSFISLPPRLLQPARLNFDFLSAEDDRKVLDLDPDVNPVGAWILPNHIDRALACYSPEGVALGEMRVVTQVSGEKAVKWFGAPGGRYAELVGVQADFSHLGDLLQGLAEAGAESFGHFYRTIDETLWTTDPLGNRVDQNLSVLVGRPLALVRVQVGFELQGPPLSDPSWPFVLTAEQPKLPSYRFPVRLGEQVLLEDGLIGYFFGNNYQQFNPVHLPEGIGPAPYLRQIGPGNYLKLKFDPGSKAVLSLLIDPRAVVHATTSILPVYTLEVPRRFVDPVLNKLQITFQAGPLLSTTQSVVDENGTATRLVVPIPAGNEGEWTWIQANDPAKAVSLQAPDDKVKFSNVELRLRSGAYVLGERDA